MHGQMRLRPWEIERLTIPEVALALDEDVSKPRAPGGGMPMSYPDKLAWIAQLRAMTPRERLEMARENR